MRSTARRIAPPFRSKTSTMGAGAVPVEAPPERERATWRDAMERFGVAMVVSYLGRESAELDDRSRATAWGG